MSSQPVDKRRSSTFQKGAALLIRPDADKLSLLPDGWFYPAEDLSEGVYNATHDLLKRLAEHGAVRTRTVNDPNSDLKDSKWNRRREYRLAEETRELVDDVLENRDAMMPCGHAGMHNCGDHFECSFELCDGEFQREELNV